jgi:putative transposase
MAVFRRRQFSAEKGICHMSETAIATLPDPSGFCADPFTDVLRDGARKLIEQAIHAELATLMTPFPKKARGRAG